MDQFTGAALKEARKGVAEVEIPIWAALFNAEGRLTAPLHVS